MSMRQMSGRARNENGTHEMPVFANSVTKTPPPAAAKAAPYDFGSGFSVTQPSLSFDWKEQSVELTIVLVCTALTTLQPGSVCNEDCEFCTILTPSNVSISPPLGH